MSKIWCLQLILSRSLLQRGHRGDGVYLTVSTIERLLMILGMMSEHCTDYIVHLLVARDDECERGEVRTTLGLWCLNPAVTFVPVAKEARAVVLASATLSPFAAVECELGTSFRVQMSVTDHVVQDDQVRENCSIDCHGARIVPLSLCVLQMQRNLHTGLGQSLSLHANSQGASRVIEATTNKWSQIVPPCNNRGWRAKRWS